MPLVPVIAIFTKFDALVQKFSWNYPIRERRSAHVKKKAEEEAQNVFKTEFLSRVNAKVYKPKEYVCLSSK